MPEIKQYTRQTRATGFVQRQNTQGAFGEGTAQALNEAGDFLGKMAVKKAKSDYVAKMSQFELDNIRRQEELSNMDFEPDVDLSEVYQKDLEVRAAELDIHPLMSDQWQSDLTNLKLNFAANGLKEGARREAIRVEENWKNTVTNIENFVAMGGSRERANQMINEAASTLPNMPKEEREVLINSAKDGVLRSEADILARKNPYKFKELVKNGAYSDLKNLSSYLSLADSSIKSLQAKQEKIRSEAKSFIRTFEDRMSKGFDVPQEDMQRAINMAGGDVEILTKIQDLQETKLIFNGLKQLSPMDLQNVINSEILPMARDNGATEKEMMLLDMSTKLLETTKQNIEKDPISWSAQNGENVEPLDITDKSSISSRIALAKANSEKYDIDPKPFTDEELDSFLNNFEKSDVNEQFLTIKEMSKAGLDSSMFFEQIGDRDSVIAHSGGLLLYSPDHELESKKMILGNKIKKENPNAIPSKDLTYSSFKEIVGNAFVNSPSTEKTIYESALSHYLGSRPETTSNQEIDEDLFKNSVNAVLGGVREGPNEFSDIVIEKNNAMFALPPNTSEDDFDNFLDMADKTTFTLFSEGGHYPTYGGQDVPISYIKKYGQFENVGANRYIIKINGQELEAETSDGLYYMNIDSQAIKEIGKSR